MDHQDTSRYIDFDQLVKRHQGLVKSLCWWYAGGRADVVSDLMQDVLAHLWRYRHTLREGSTVAQERAWVRLHCRSVFEHQRRRTRVETVPMEEALHVAAEDTTARDAIERLAVGLNEMEHKVLEMMLDEYTDGEIAAILHITAAEARRLHTTVIEKMKQKAGIKV